MALLEFHKSFNSFSMNDRTENQTIADHRQIYRRSNTGTET